MRISEIREMPIVVKETPLGGGGIHESVLRGYQILEKTKYLLSEGVPAKIVLELIEEMEGK